MKPKDYIFISILAAMIIAGIFLKGFLGGYIVGTCSVLVITVTVGKILFIKSQKRIDAAMRFRKMMKD
jgi:hypothetical protein